MSTTATDIISKLEQHIESECKRIDVEQAFDDMLDECYSFSDVGGPFARMIPSRVLREVDPTAHRCGVNDYADGQEWIELNSDYYEQDAAEKAKESFIEEVESEISTLESEIEEMESEEVPQLEEIGALKAKLADTRSELAALNKHSF